MVTHFKAHMWVIMVTTFDGMHKSAGWKRVWVDWVKTHHSYPFQGTCLSRLGGHSPQLPISRHVFESAWWTFATVTHFKARVWVGLVDIHHSYPFQGMCMSRLGVTHFKVRLWVNKVETRHGYPYQDACVSRLGGNSPWLPISRYSCKPAGRRHMWASGVRRTYSF